MSLKLKSEENFSLVKKCLDADSHKSAVAGRAYYSVFQRIKHALESGGFDYERFLQQRNITDQKAYSHGTLPMAAREFLKRLLMDKIDKIFDHIQIVFAERFPTVNLWQRYDSSSGDVFFLVDDSELFESATMQDTIQECTELYFWRNGLFNVFFACHQSRTSLGGWQSIPIHPQEA